MIDVKQLKNIRRKWRTALNKENKLSNYFASKNAALSLEKSVGISIGYSFCLQDLDKLIRELEKE